MRQEGRVVIRYADHVDVRTGLRQPLQPCVRRSGRDNLNGRRRRGRCGWRGGGKDEAKAERDALHERCVRFTTRSGRQWVSERILTRARRLCCVDLAAAGVDTGVDWSRPTLDTAREAETTD